MKKFVTFTITIVILILPFSGVFANSNPNDSGFEFVFCDKYSNDVNFLKQTEEDIQLQIDIFEDILGIKLDDINTFNIYPCENKSFKISAKSEKGIVNCIVSRDFKDSIGKTNPVFSSIIRSIWPKCPIKTVNILSLYLTFKYLEIQPIKLAAEIRYAYSHIPIINNPDSRNHTNSQHINTPILAATRIYQLEDELEPVEFKRFLYSSRFGIIKSLERYLSTDFSTFVRSLRFETQKDDIFSKVVPTESTKELLHYIEEQRTKLWNNFPQFSSNYDYLIRMKPSMSLYQSIIQIAQGATETDIKKSISTVDDFFVWKKGINNKSWLILLIGIIAIILMLFISLSKGIKFIKYPGGKK